jgi:hypothetical protein
MKKIEKSALTAALAASLCLGRALSAPGASQPAPFSAAAPGDKLPPGWEETALPNIERRTRYDLARDGDVTVLRARSEVAASSVSHALDIDPARTPILSWRWKVSRVLDKADLASKAGDDYAARVYVLFDYDTSRLPFLARSKIALARAFYGDAVPAAALCYVWDNRYPIGTNTWSAYTDRVRMIVLENGKARVGLWTSETRDIDADFRAAFGEAPPKIIGAVLAVDTDNTGESAESWFGDLAFQPKPVKKETATQ